MRKAALLFGLCAIGLASRAHGQAWELFEAARLPAGWSVSGADAEVVDSPAMQGEHSLEWSWSEARSSLTWDLAEPLSGSGHRVFSQWVRLESPLPESRLRVELRSSDGSTRSFEMHLDFTGWRTVFVPYSSMEGGGSNAINRVRWSLTGGPPSGVLYLDQVIVGQAMDVRFQYADRQVPFVWEERNKSMWENRVHWYRRQPSAVSPGSDELLDVRRLRESWDARLVEAGSVTASMVDRWETRMNEFRLRREAGRVRGNPIYYRQYPGYAYPPDLAARLEGTQGPNSFQQYTTLMLEMARGWHRTSDATLRDRIAGMLILMSEHLLDQGWAAGSNQGSVFLLGYQAREYFRAVYLARDILAEAGLLEEMGEAARWYGQAGSLLDDERAPNMDFFNTLAQGQMLSLLMEPDDRRAVAWLRAFSDSMTRQLADLRPGDANGFKPDGTAFHHNGHYPAYALGAIRTLGEIFDVLHDSPFRFGEIGRMSFRKVLLAARAYSQLHDWPIGISGRHPFRGDISSASGAFAALAKYADPHDNVAPDREMAAAYVRLWGQPGGELGTLFSEAGVQAEDLQGFFTFPFANHAVYRSDDWMVSLKGYSRYVWSSEIYTADNRYGRYQSNGTAEILLSSGRTGSGFREEGWDWNRLPGTTGVHLPLDQLESPRAGTLMLRSNETMAGGLTAGAAGVFGFVLREQEFGHTLQARKSIFAADGMLIALGSGISSDHATAAAETALFQVSLDEERAPLILSTAPDSPVTAFPWSWQATPSAPFWVIDPIGNGFWVPPAQRLRLSRAVQQSRQNKTRAHTSGEFATGWIDHGVGAGSEAYHYVILPQTSSGDMRKFADRMASSDPAYEVLHQDAALHAVRISAPVRFGFAVFEPGRWEDLPHLIEVETPSLLWIEEAGGELLMSVANPDLNPGETENRVTPTGFTLRGLWNEAEGDGTDSLLWHENGNTRIVVPAREGASVPLRLESASAASPWSQEAAGGELSSVENFRAIPPGGNFFAWDAAANATRGYVIERLHPPAGDVRPVAFLTRETTEFLAVEPAGETLAYYRVRKWGDSGLGAPTRSVLVFDPGTQSARYDFRAISGVDELRGQGWTSSGLQSESDWYVGGEGMFLIDNSSTDPASITVPLTPRSTGRAAARMGVARMANFHARIELVAGDQSLGLIQLTTRTNGFLRGPGDVEFTDTRWDVEQGTLRDVAIEWREISGTDRMEIALTYTGTTDSASAVNRWEVANIPANHPDRIRFSVGFGSAVNRGLVLEMLELVSLAPRSLSLFYRAWSEAFLGEADADPAADGSGNGVSNFWEFLFALNPADPLERVKPEIAPRLERAAAASRFVWEVPVMEGIRFQVRGTANLGGSWQILPHQEVAGAPGWAKILTPPFDTEDRAHFYRLVLLADLD